MKLILPLIALLTGGAAPIFMLLLSTGVAEWVQGLTKMPEVLMSAHAFARVYLWAALIPSLVVLLGIALYSRKRHPDLYNRIWAGLAAGAVATVFLDFFRMMGVIHGWLPSDTPPFFGKLILGPQAPVGAVLTVGFLYHFLNGASFALPYALLFGRPRWYWGMAWALIYELGMMALPPMAPLFGPFGSKTGGPGFFLITLVAHIAFGAVLGLLVERWVKRPGSIFSVLKGSSHA
jgi:hypothetical protein